MSKFPTSQCLREWYRCPLPLMIFIIFFFLFIYTCFILIKCSQLIKKAEEMGTDAFEANYNKQLKHVTQVYVANLLICILCIIVLTFFLYKALPPEQQSGLFNEYAGGVILLAVFVITCWTLNFFQTVSHSERDVSVISTSSIVMVLALIAIGAYIYRIVENTKKLGMKS